MLLLLYGYTTLNVLHLATHIYETSPPAFSGCPRPRFHVELACAEGRGQHLCAYEAQPEPRPGPHRQVGRHGITFFPAIFSMVTNADTPEDKYLASEIVGIRHVAPPQAAHRPSAEGGGGRSSMPSEYALSAPAQGLSGLGHSVVYLPV